MVDEPFTQILRAAHAGDRAAADRAYAVVYPELRKIARARLRGQGHHTLLDTEALVHESFMRLVAVDQLGIADRHHFFAYAAKTMRSIVIDFARRRLATRRGGAAVHVTLDSEVQGTLQSDASILGVDEALADLETLEPRLAQVVEMRYFGGYSDGEIAAALGVTPRTVGRDWEKARAFILAQMQP